MLLFFPFTDSGPFLLCPCRSFVFRKVWLRLLRCRLFLETTAKASLSFIPGWAIGVLGFQCWLQAVLLKGLGCKFAAGSIQEACHGGCWHSVLPSLRRLLCFLSSVAVQVVMLYTQHRPMRDGSVTALVTFPAGRCRHGGMIGFLLLLQLCRAVKSLHRARRQPPHRVAPQALRVLQQWHVGFRANRQRLRQASVALSS